MPHINDKVADWSARFGHILRASAETQFSHLYKGAVGGLEHVVSVDNGGSYMEMWRDGGDQYYATTGAAIKPLPGIAKGARLDEALDRFFVLMAKKGMGRAERPARQRPQRKAIPKKIKRLAGVRKNVVEKVDPEIGPSLSVGHRQPSDLSPESSVRKLAHRLVKNVVALTGNQVGSGRVKPARTRMVRQDAMGRRTSSRRTKPDFGRMQAKLEGGRTKPGGGTTPIKPATGGPGQPTSYGSTGQPQYNYGRYRKACPCNEVAKTMKAVTR